MFSTVAMFIMHYSPPCCGGRHFQLIYIRRQLCNHIKYWKPGLQKSTSFHRRQTRWHGLVEWQLHLRATLSCAVCSRCSRWYRCHQSVTKVSPRCHQGVMGTLPVEHRSPVICAKRWRLANPACNHARHIVLFCCLEI